VQYELFAIENKEDEWLPPLLEAFSLGEEEEGREDIIFDAIYNGGNTCAPEVKNILDIYRMRYSDML
jgi:hypothetical protein